MKLFKAKRIFNTKVSHLLTRPDFNNEYQHEFLRKMTNNEIQIFLKEIKNMLKIEGIGTKNINQYNKIFKYFILEHKEV